MQYSVFADESGIHSGYKCYSIGTLVIPNDKLDYFEAMFFKLKSIHKIKNEIKWHNVKSSYNIINFGLDLFHFIISCKFKLSFIVVKKDIYNNWNNDNKEVAFYKTYSLLFSNILKLQTGQYRVFIDDRSDSYSKQDEVVQNICNYVLKNDDHASRVNSIGKRDSKISVGIQTSDLFTGAICTSHNIYLDKDFNCHKGKLLFIKKIAEVLGWDNLCYDTMPKVNPNIWHFPQVGYRDLPKTLAIKINNNVLKVKLTDL